MEDQTGHAGDPMPGMDMGGGDVGVHGMLMVGEDAIFLSHLPMFQPPHNFQVLLRVTLSAEGADPRRQYLDDRATSDTKLYTFVPEEFPIGDLIGQSPAPPKVTSFNGAIFRGHFERGGTQLLSDVTASVEKVLRFAELDPEAKPSEGQELTYLCFGDHGDLYMAHRITARPSFDHVLSFQTVDPDLADRDFHEATPVVFEGRDDSPESRLPGLDDVSAFFRQSIGPRGQHGFQTQLRIGEELYFEVDELA